MKAFGGLLVLIDILLLVVKILYYIGEGIYRLIVPVEQKSVVGEIVLVTGAGHGIGRELALKYASLGAIVVCWDVNQEGNDETLNEIKQISETKAYGYKCDVSNREEVFKVAEKVKEEVGNVTILINNAGIMPCHSFLNHTPEEIRRTFEINVFAHFWTLQAFLPSMIEKNYGHVVAISSLAGMTGVANVVPYSATKFAVRGLMDSLNEEMRTLKNDGKSLNIHFTTIVPYMVNTGMCKKPKFRFPCMSLVSPKEAAAVIVKAQRRNIRQISVPSFWLYVLSFLKCMPDSSMFCIADFLSSGLEPDS
ncbi:unnamed protein product [Xylocopa violacea]